MIVNLILNIPSRPGYLTQVQGALSFLASPMVLGFSEIYWECPTSKKTFGIRITRGQREQGTYYRDPYPVTLALLGHNMPGMPHLEILLTPDDVERLRNTLRLKLDGLPL